MSHARAAALTEAMSLQGRGLRHYHESHLSATVELLRHSQELAMASGFTEMEDDSRFWHGVALHGSGRLEEALAAWGPALSRGESLELTKSRYMALTRILMLAIDFPLPLHTIEKTLEKVSDRLGATMGPGGSRRSRVLLARSRLELARGRNDAGFALAQEALQRQGCESEVYSLSTYYRTLVRATLSLGDLESAEAYVNEWDATEWAYPQSKRILLMVARAEIARARGRASECWRIAEPLEADVRELEDVGTCHDARVTFVRACLAAARPARARSVLSHMLRRRRSVVGEHRYETYLVLGEYHQAAVERDGPAPKGLRHAEWARRAYGRALVEGRRLDSLLQCRHRQDEVDRRMQSPNGGRDRAWPTRDLQLHLDLGGSP